MRFLNFMKYSIKVFQIFQANYDYSTHSVLSIDEPNLGIIEMMIKFCSEMILRGANTVKLNIKINKRNK